MNKKFLKNIKEILSNQKKELLLQSTQEVDIDVDGDETDLIQANQILLVHNELTSRNSNKLLRIEAALKRIEDNSYGICEDCEELIAEKRLIHNPYYQTCISCAEERENIEKQKRRF